VLALYLMSAPTGSRIGLFYCPIVTMMHDTGLEEGEVQAALEAIGEIAQYDFDEELVWMPNGCREQMSLPDGSGIKSTDKAVKSVLTELGAFGDHPFALEFKSRYLSGENAPSKPLGRGMQDNSMGHAASSHAPLSVSVSSPSPSTSPDPEDRVQCPPVDEILNSNQVSTLETSMIPIWAIRQLIARFVAKNQASKSDLRTREHWSKCCVIAVQSDWNDRRRRPKKPEADDSEPTAEDLGFVS